MTTKRVKIIRRAIETREEMERLVGEIAALVNDRSVMLSEMESKLQNIRAEYESRLVENSLLVEEKIPVAQDWAERNADVFGAKKSMEMVHATVGFRTGTPKLKTVRGWTWDAVKIWLSKHGQEYIRTETAVDKESILADRKELNEDGLLKMGLKVKQDESFFVEPKQEAIT